MTNLTEAQVLAIGNSNGTQEAMARKFGVSGATVWRIRNEVTWRRTERINFATRVILVVGREQIWLHRDP